MNKGIEAISIRCQYQNDALHWFTSSFHSTTIRTVRRQQNVNYRLTG
nr:MAG TPA: hypothetical protein [Caudoviricetes sp.]